MAHPLPVVLTPIEADLRRAASSLCAGGLVLTRPRHTMGWPWIPFPRSGHATRRSEGRGEGARSRSWCPAWRISLGSPRSCPPRPWPWRLGTGQARSRSCCPPGLDCPRPSSAAGRGRAAFVSPRGHGLGHGVRQAITATSANRSGAPPARTAPRPRSPFRMPMS